jgi:WD40 repeat protein
LATNSGEGEEAVRVWDLATQKERLRLKGSRRIEALVHFSQDGKWIVTSGYESLSATVWDLTTGKQLRRISLPTRLRRALFSPDGGTLFTESLDGAILVWDLQTDRLLPISADPITAVREIRFAREGSRLIGKADFFRVWDSKTGREAPKFSEAPGIRDVSPDETLLARSEEDGTVRLLDSTTGRVLRSWKAHDRTLWVLRFSSDGKRLVSTGGLDPVIRIWDPTTGTCCRELHGHREGELQLEVSRDGRLVAGCGNRAGDDADLRLWDLNTGRELARFARRAGPTHHPAFSPDGRWLAVATEHPNGPNANEMVQVWEVATGKLLCSLAGHKETVTALTFSGDSQIVATGGVDRTVRLWDLASGQEIKRFLGHEGMILSLAFAPDNLRLAASSPDAPLYIWDVAAWTRRYPSRLGLAKSQPETLWLDLANEDPSKAYRAVLALAATPAQSLVLLRNKLQPAPNPDRAHIEKLVADLDSPQFPQREQAALALTQLPDGAAGLLRETLNKSSSLEVRRRLQRVLDGMEVLKPEQLRAARAVEVLEKLATGEAVRFLAELARGTPEAHLTGEAVAAIRRLRESREGK